MVQKTYSRLTIRAGKTAQEQIRERGFSPDLFSTLVGASGGPKWLVLSQLDRVLADMFVGARATPLEMVGSSIGTFRHACLVQADPVGALERFEESYIGQAYEQQPTGAEVSRASERILNILLGDVGAARVARHDRFRSHIVAARLRAGFGQLPYGLPVALGLSAIGNLVTRDALGAAFERALFSSAPIEGNHKSGFDFERYETQSVPLTEANVAKAILASGTIPFVMEGVRDIEGASPGLYLDGGLLDYHFDFRFDAPPGLIFYPHFFDAIVPGWLDKNLPWRKVPASDLDRVVLVAPSREFVAALPGGRVPDRSDFERWGTAERQRTWHQVVKECLALADEFNDLVAGNRLADVIQPF